MCHNYMQLPDYNYSNSDVICRYIYGTSLYSSYSHDRGPYYYVKYLAKVVAIYSHALDSVVYIAIAS